MVFQFLSFLHVPFTPDHFIIVCNTQFIKTWPFRLGYAWVTVYTIYNDVYVCNISRYITSPTTPRNCRAINKSLVGIKIVIYQSDPHYIIYFPFICLFILSRVYCKYILLNLLPRLYRI